VRGGLREHSARGTIINAAFRISLAGLNLLQRFLVVAFLTPAEFGLWGLVFVGLMTLLFIKSVGVMDKFIQQSDSDQEVAFQKAFTIELILTVAVVVLAVALFPVFAIAYGRWDIVFPGVLLSLAVVGKGLQAPTWIFYRQMRFVRQRTLEAINPVITFVVTIGLAAGGAGYWSLIIGALVGSWIGGIFALRACPYRIRFRLDRATAGEYFQFSWPLVVAQMAGVAIGLGSTLVGMQTVGLAGVGAIGLAVTITTFSNGVNNIVTQTLYPAICVVRNRADLMAETFVKSNRLALMWGVPFGLGLTLFGSDLIRFVIGERWQSAVFLLQVFGVIAAIDQIGFNWTAFLRARNYTRPLAVIGVVAILAFCAITIPLLITGGLRGYAFGMLGMALVVLAARIHYLDRLFSGFRIWSHAARAIVPSIPAVVVVLTLRVVEGGDRTLAIAAMEFVVYVATTVFVTAYFERGLLRELFGYLRRKPVAAIPIGEKSTSG